MSQIETIGSAQDYVNYTFNVEARGVAEVSSELVGLSNTVGNILGQLAFKTSEFLTHTESLAIGAGAAISALYVSATQDAIHFQQQVANVQAIGGEAVDAQGIGSAAMEYSNKFGMATASMTEGLESLARAGITTTSVMKGVLEEGVKLSKLEGVDLEDSINDLISTTNLLAADDVNMNDAVYAEMVKTMNQHIVSTSESAPINAQNIIQSLQHVGGYASASGIDQDDLFAVIAQLGARGTKGEMAGTALRAFVAAGQKDTAQRALSRIGLNVSDLWNSDGETMLSISEMKDVLDEALEARGYSKQEKLEFYSDFVGYKQANQIMKIDTSEVAQYKESIANAWDLGKKLDTILGTVRGNLDRIWQITQNFMTKVGGQLLTVANVILTPIRILLDVFTKIPFADTAVAASMIFIAFRTGLAIFTKLAPAVVGFMSGLNDAKDTTRGFRGEWEKTRDQVQKTKEIIDLIRARDVSGLVSKHYEEHGLSAKHKREAQLVVAGQMYMMSDEYKQSGISWHQLSAAVQEQILAKYQSNQHEAFQQNYQDYVERTNKFADRVTNEGPIIKSYSGRDDVAVISKYVQWIFKLFSDGSWVPPRDPVNNRGGGSENTTSDNRTQNYLSRLFKSKVDGNVYGNLEFQYREGEESYYQLREDINKNLQDIRRRTQDFTNTDVNRINNAQIRTHLKAWKPASDIGREKSLQANKSEIRMVFEEGRLAHHEHPNEGLKDDQIKIMAEAVGLSGYENFDSRRGGNRAQAARAIHQAYQQRHGSKSLQERQSILDSIFDLKNEQDENLEDIWNRNFGQVAQGPRRIMFQNTSIAEQIVKELAGMQMQGDEAVNLVYDMVNSGNLSRSQEKRIAQITMAGLQRDDGSTIFQDNELKFMLETREMLNNTIKFFNDNASDIGLSDSVQEEINRVIDAINQDTEVLRNGGRELGEAIVHGFVVEGMGIHSPGYAAKATIEEGERIVNAVKSIIKPAEDAGLQVGRTLSHAIQQGIDDDGFKSEGEEAVNLKKAREYIMDEFHPNDFENFSPSPYGKNTSVDKIVDEQNKIALAQDAEWIEGFQGYIYPIGTDIANAQRYGIDNFRIKNIKHVPYDTLLQTYIEDELIDRHGDIGFDFMETFADWVYELASEKGNYWDNTFNADYADDYWIGGFEGGQEVFNELRQEFENLYRAYIQTAAMGAQSLLESSPLSTAMISYRGGQLYTPINDFGAFDTITSTSLKWDTANSFWKKNPRARDILQIYNPEGIPGIIAHTDILNDQNKHLWSRERELTLAQGQPYLHIPNPDENAPEKTLIALSPDQQKAVKEIMGEGFEFRKNQYDTLSEAEKRKWNLNKISEQYADSQSVTVEDIKDFSLDFLESFESAGEIGAHQDVLRNMFTATKLNRDVLTQSNIADKIQDFFINGEIGTIGDYRGGSLGGTSLDNAITIYPGSVKYHADNYHEEYGDYGTKLLDTVIHEMTHVLMMHTERKNYHNNNIPAELGIDNFTTDQNYLGYTKNFVAEYEANYVTTEVLSRLGIEASAKNHQRLAKFKELIDQKGYGDQIQYELLDTLVDEMLNNISVIGDITSQMSTRFDTLAANMTLADVNEEMRPVLTKIQNFNKDASLYTAPNISNKADMVKQILSDMTDDMDKLWDSGIVDESLIYDLMSQKYTSYIQSLNDGYNFDTYYKYASPSFKSEGKKSIHMSQPLTSMTLLELLNNNPDLEEITVPPSLYNRIAKKYIGALEEVGVNVRKEYNWGAKSQSNGLEFKALDLFNDGLAPKQIAEQLDIPLSRAYYLLNKVGVKSNNRKRKHDHDKVQALVDEGLSAKDISNQLDIPLRSVYNIIKKNKSTQAQQDGFKSAGEDEFSLYNFFGPLNEDNIDLIEDKVKEYHNYIKSQRKIITGNIVAASKEQQLIYNSLSDWKQNPETSNKTVMPFDTLKQSIINKSDKETAELAIQWINDNYGPNGKIGKMLGTSKNGVYVSRMQKIIEANSDLSKVVSDYINIPVTTKEGEEKVIQLPLHSAEPHYQTNKKGEYILDESGNKILDQSYMNKFIHSATKIDMTKKGKKIKVQVTHQGISEILDSDDFRSLPLKEQAKVYDAIIEHEGHTISDVLAPDEKIKKSMKPHRKFGVLNTGTTGLSCPNRMSKGTCPFTQHCYAARDMQRLPNVSKNQMQKASYFTSHNVEEIVQDILDRELSVVRINQEGDIASLKELEKVIDIANALPKVKFYGYTKSLEVLKYMDDEGLPKNLAINNSLGTSETGNYVAASFYELADYIEKGYKLCLGACAECEKCTNDLINKVTLLRDGTISKIFKVDDLKGFYPYEQVEILKRLYDAEANNKTLNEELIKSTIAKVDAEVSGYSNKERIQRNEEFYANLRKNNGFQSAGEEDNGFQSAGEEEYKRLPELMDIFDIGEGNLLDVGYGIYKNNMTDFFHQIDNIWNQEYNYREERGKKQIDDGYAGIRQILNMKHNISGYKDDAINNVASRLQNYGIYWNKKSASEALDTGIEELINLFDRDAVKQALEQEIISINQLTKWHKQLQGSVAEDRYGEVPWTLDDVNKWNQDKIEADAALQKIIADRRNTGEDTEQITNGQFVMTPEIRDFISQQSTSRTDDNQKREKENHKNIRQLLSSIVLNYGQRGIIQKLLTEGKNDELVQEVKKTRQSTQSPNKKDRQLTLDNFTEASTKTPSFIESYLDFAINAHKNQQQNQNTLIHARTKSDEISAMNYAHMNMSNAYADYAFQAAEERKKEQEHLINLRTQSDVKKAQKTTSSNNKKTKTKCCDELIALLQQIVTFLDIIVRGTVITALKTTLPKPKKKDKLSMPGLFVGANYINFMNEVSEREIEIALLRKQMADDEKRWAEEGIEYAKEKREALKRRREEQKKVHQEQREQANKERTDRIFNQQYNHIYGVGVQNPSSEAKEKYDNEKEQEQATFGRGQSFYDFLNSEAYKKMNDGTFFMNRFDKARHAINEGGGNKWLLKGVNTAEKIYGKINAQANNLLDKLISILPDEHSGTNAYGQAFDFLGEQKQYVLNFRNSLESLSRVFPVLTPAVVGFDIALQGIETTMNVLEPIMKFQNGEKTGTLILDTIQKWAKDPTLKDTVRGKIGILGTKAIDGVSKGLIQLATKVMPMLMGVLVPLLAILAVVAAVVGGLYIWEKKHAEALKERQEQLKEATAQNKVALSQYKDLKKSREAETDAVKRQQKARKEAIALYKLEAARIKQRKLVHEEANLRNHAVWGEYGLRATLQKMGLGFIAGGDFQSQYENYDGTTKNIRQIKEGTLGNLFATSEQRQVSRVYDRNKMFFAEVEAYKEPLQALYDKESRLIEQYGSIDNARASKEFYEAVQDFADATDINGETAVKMLDWLETENKVDQATEAMQTQVDVITARADAKALAAEMGVEDFSDEGLQDAMIYAQAQSIYKDAYDYLWWESAKAELFGILWTIYDTINVLDLTDHATKYWKKSEAYQEGMKELSELGVSGLAEVGENTAKHADRRNYGKGGGVNYGDTPFSGAKAAMAESYADQKQKEDYKKYGIVYSSDEYNDLQESHDIYLHSHLQASINDSLAKEKTYVDNETQALEVSLNEGMNQAGQQGVEGFKEGLDQHSPGAISRSIRDEMIYSNSFINQSMPELFDLSYNLGIGMTDRYEDGIAILQAIGEEVAQMSDTMQDAKPVLGGESYALGKEMTDNHQSALSMSDNTQEEMVNVNDAIEDSKAIINPTAYDAGYEAGEEYGKGFKDGLKDLYEQISSPEALEASLYDRIIAKQGLGLPAGADPNDPQVQQEQEERFNETLIKTLVRGEGGLPLLGLAKSEGKAALKVARDGGVSWKDASVVGRIVNAVEVGKSSGAKAGLKALFSPKYGEEFGVEGATHALKKALGREAAEDVGKTATGKTAGVVDDALRGVGKKGSKYTNKILTKLGGEGTESLSEGVVKFIARNFGDDAAKLAVKGGSKLAKAVPFIGTGITAAMSIAEHNPFEKHYNEDGSEKRAFQSSGEVLGEIGGALAADVIGVVAGPVAGMAAGLILEPIGEAIGGTWGWIADEVVNTDIKDILAGGNELLGGVPGQIFDIMSNSPIGDIGRGIWGHLDNLTGGWLGDTWDNVYNSSIAELTGLDQLGGALQGLGEWLFGTGEEEENSSEVTTDGTNIDALQSYMTGSNLMMPYALEMEERKKKDSWYRRYNEFAEGKQDFNLALLYGARNIFDMMVDTGGFDIYKGLLDSDNLNIIYKRFQESISETPPIDDISIDKVGQKMPTHKAETSIIIKNININTEDDPEKIKSALMNLIIEMQEQVSPRQVSRTVGEPPSVSTDASTDTNNQDQAEGQDEQNANGNTNTNNNPTT